MDCNTSCLDGLQLALEPLWKLYEVCNQGTDVKAVLSKAVKSLGLTQVRPYPSCTDYIDFLFISHNNNTLYKFHTLHLVYISHVLL